MAENMIFMYFVKFDLANMALQIFDTRATLNLNLRCLENFWII